MPTVKQMDGIPGITQAGLSKMFSKMEKTKIEQAESECSTRVGASSAGSNAEQQAVKEDGIGDAASAPESDDSDTRRLVPSDVAGFDGTESQSN